MREFHYDDHVQIVICVFVFNLTCLFCWVCCGKVEKLMLFVV